MAKQTELVDLAMTEKSDYGDGTTRIRLEGVTTAIDAFVPSKWAEKIEAGSKMKVTIEAE